MTAELIHNTDFSREKQGQTEEEIRRTVEELVEQVFEDDHVLTRQQLLERLGVGEGTLADAIRSGRLQRVKVSERRVVFTKATVRRYLLAVQDLPDLVPNPTGANGRKAATNGRRRRRAVPT